MANEGGAKGGSLCVTLSLGEFGRVAQGQSEARKEVELEFLGMWRFQHTGTLVGAGFRVCLSCLV